MALERPRVYPRSRRTQRAAIRWWPAAVVGGVASARKRLCKPSLEALHDEGRAVVIGKLHAPPSTPVRCTTEFDQPPCVEPSAEQEPR